MTREFTGALPPAGTLRVVHTSLDPSSDDELMLDLLRTVVELTAQERPFLASVAQIALDSDSDIERHAALASLYRLALEHEQPYVTDLADDLLSWIELRTVRTG